MKFQREFQDRTKGENMKLKTAPCLFLACGVLVAPGTALAMKHPNPVANSGIHAHLIHTDPVPNSHPNRTT